MPGQVLNADVSAAFIAQARALLATDYLPKIERCLERLTAEQIWWRPNDESNSIGNLLLHLSGNARQWIVSGLGGAADSRARQTEFDERSLIPCEELRNRLRDTLSEVDRVMADFQTPRLLELFQIQGSDVTALEAILHVVEHFSMHTGQIILLTKLLTASDLHFYDFQADAPLRRFSSSSS